MEKLVLKGGNAIDVIISKYLGGASVDLDYSLIDKMAHNKFRYNQRKN
jgi:predicted nucleotidyltransferase component of viral defense system